jgi:hypothetical protein
MALTVASAAWSASSSPAPTQAVAPSRLPSSADTVASPAPSAPENTICSQCGSPSNTTLPPSPTTTLGTLTVGPPTGSNAYVSGTPPVYCTTSYQSSSWPPTAAPEVTAHLLTPQDVPAGLTSTPPVIATNGPSLDEIAAGFPDDPIAEADYATNQEPYFGISEILGEAPTPQAAEATFTFAKSHIYGDCQYFWGDSLPPAFALPQSGSHVAAFEVLSGSSYSSDAWVVILGCEGDFDFDLTVGNSTGYPDTQQAVLPTETQVSQAVNATLQRISE